MDVHANMDVLGLGSNMTKVVHRYGSDIHSNFLFARPLNSSSDFFKNSHIHTQHSEQIAHIRDIMRSPDIPSFEYIEEFKGTMLEENINSTSQLEKAIHMAISSGSMYLFNCVLKNQSKDILLDRLYFCHVVALKYALFYNKFNFVGWFVLALIKYDSLLKNREPLTLLYNNAPTLEKILEYAIRSNNKESVTWVLKWFMSQNPMYFQIYILVQSGLKCSFECNNTEMFRRVKVEIIDTDVQSRRTQDI